LTPPHIQRWHIIAGATVLTIAAGCAESPVNQTAETQERIQVAAATMEDATIVDCELPGSMKRLGGSMTYLSPGRLVRVTAIECRVRGGEYEVADLGGGTISLQRWQPYADSGDPEAQYFVATIHRFGIGNPVDYAKAAEWYQKASDQGYDKATLELAILYEQGLGVPQDELKALNLHRKGSGLGDDLDYAANVAKARDEAAAEVAALTEQLENRNAETVALQTELETMRFELGQRQTEVLAAQEKALQLEQQIATQRGGGGDPAAAAKIQQLEAELALQQSIIAQKNKEISALSSSADKETQRLVRSLELAQEKSIELEEKLAVQQQENVDNRTQLARVQAQLERAEAELSDVQFRYLEETQKLQADQERLSALKATLSAENAAAIGSLEQELADKSAQLDQREQRINSLERETDELRAEVAGLLAAAAADKSEYEKELSDLREVAEQQRVAVRSSEATVASLRRRLSETESELAALRAQYAAETDTMRADRQELNRLAAAEREENARQISELELWLQTSESELANSMNRIQALEQEKLRLSQELGTLAAAGRNQSHSQASEIASLQEQLRVAQAELSETRQKAWADKAQLSRDFARAAKERDLLRSQLQQSAGASEGEVSRLRSELDRRERELEARKREIAELEAQVQNEQKVVADLQDMVAKNTRNIARPSPRAASPAYEQPLLDEVRRSVPLGDYFALVIGNSDYRYMRDLKTATTDARMVADLLELRYGFQVKLLLDATSDQIAAAIERYRQTLDENDNFLIYYAGHGELVTQRNGTELGYWLGVDSRSDMQTTWLPDWQVRNQVDQMSAKHVLIVADSCFSGAFTRGAAGPAVMPGASRAMAIAKYERLSRRKARLYITSGGTEPVYDVGGGQNSLFASSFIRLLRQNNTVLPTQYLYTGVYQGVARDADKMGVSQTPQYAEIPNVGHAHGDFLFVPRQPVLASETNFRPGG
jgi:hypothetical protein